MTTTHPRTKQFLASLAIGAAILSLTPIFAAPPLTAALAQDGDSVSSEFRTALSPYGTWKRHPRWGEVWVYNQEEPDWRPYTRGRWIWTDEWGWYWDVGPEEYAWGWVAYHYGRWAYDHDFGWVWIPGDEWGPAWVDWREGDDYVGWAPLPPDDLYADFVDDPIYWSFVRPRFFLAPRVFAFCVPARERIVIIRKTKFVDRDRDRDHPRRFSGRDRDRPRGGDRDRESPRRAVNRGIDPGVIARATGSPVRASRVEPAVLKGTKVEGTREVDASEGGRVRAPVRSTGKVIRPGERVRPREAVVHDRARSADQPERTGRDAGLRPRDAGQAGPDVGRTDTDAGPKSEGNRASGDNDRNRPSQITVIRGGVSGGSETSTPRPAVRDRDAERESRIEVQRPPVVRPPSRPMVQERRGENARANLPPPTPPVVRRPPPPSPPVARAPSPPPQAFSPPRRQEFRGGGGGGGNRGDNRQDQRGR